MTSMQNSKRMLLSGVTGVALLLTGMARGALIAHTQTINLTPGLISISGQTDSPSKNFSGTVKITGNFSVPVDVLADPYLNAVQVELRAAYQYDTQIIFFEFGSVRLDVVGSARAASGGGGATELVIGGATSVPPYDATAEVAYADGDPSQFVQAPTLSSTFVGISGLYTSGSAQFDYMTTPTVNWEVDFYFDVLGTELTAFVDSPFLDGSADFNYELAASQLIVTYYIPEPSAITLLGLGAFTCRRRRRR